MGQKRNKKSTFAHFQWGTKRFDHRCHFARGKTCPQKASRGPNHFVLVMPPAGPGRGLVLNNLVLMLSIMPPAGPGRGLVEVVVLKTSVI